MGVSRKDKMISYAKSYQKDENCPGCLRKHAEKHWSVYSSKKTKVKIWTAET